MFRNKNNREIRVVNGKATINGKTENINKLVYKHFGGYKPETFNDEIFKEYDSHYSISNYGRVWNRLMGRTIKPIIRKSGKLVFFANRQDRVYIDIQVAKLFIDNPDNLMKVDHINGDLSDNRAVNLKWRPKKEIKEKMILELIPEKYEVFKIIENFEDYLVSNHGRIWSNKTKNILTPKVSNRGYYQVNMSNKNKSYCLLVHRIVAKAFIDNPHDKPQVNHINKDRLNNNYNNLEWVTDQENKDHARQLRLKP